MSNENQNNEEQNEENFQNYQNETGNEDQVNQADLNHESYSQKEDENNNNEKEMEYENNQEQNQEEIKEIDEEEEKEKYKQIYSQIQNEIKDVVINKLLNQIILSEKQQENLRKENEILKANIVFILKKMLVDQRTVNSKLGGYEYTKNKNNRSNINQGNYFEIMGNASKSYEDNKQFENKLNGYIKSLYTRNISNSKNYMANNNYDSNNPFNQEFKKNFTDRSRCNSSSYLNTEIVRSNSQRILDRNCGLRDLTSYQPKFVPKNPKTTITQGNNPRKIEVHKRVVSPGYMQNSTDTKVKSKPNKLPPKVKLNAFKKNT